MNLKAGGLYFIKGCWFKCLPASCCIPTYRMEAFVLVLSLVAALIQESIKAELVDE